MTAVSERWRGAEAGDAFAAGPRLQPGQTTRWLAAHLRPAAGRLLLVLLLSMLAVAAGLAQPWLTKRLIDDGLIAGRFDIVLDTAALMVALATAALLIGGSTRLLFAATSARILHGLRESMVAHVLSLPPSFFSRTRQGDLMVRLDGDIAEIQRFALDLLLSATNSVLLLVGAFVVLYQLSPLLTAVMAALLIVNALSIAWLRPRVERLTRRVRERGVDLAAFFLEVLGAYKSVQAFNAQAREGQRLHDLHGRLRHDTLRLQFVGYAAGALPGFALALGTVGVFVLGSWTMLGGGAMTIGTLIAFATYLQRASGPVQSLLGLFVAAQRVRVSLDRVDELAAEKPAVTTPAQPVELPPDGAGRIEIEALTFAYPGLRTDSSTGASFSLPFKGRVGVGMGSGLAKPDPIPHLTSPLSHGIPPLRGIKGEEPLQLAPMAGQERRIFDGASLRIPAGAKVLLRGRSGAGKSTLVDLLQRHADPGAGAIRLDGVDLRALDLAALRRAVVVVAQDPLLFSGSIAENIRYGRPDATAAEVDEAIRLARVDEFLPTLDGGAQASVGQRGAALSGGQRQRVALARALLMNPRVLVLDEGTSAVDGVIDAEIGAAIDALFAGRTRIVVSHRALPEAGFDLVVDLEAGRLHVAGERPGT